MIPQNPVYLPGKYTILSNENYNRKQKSHTANSFFDIKSNSSHCLILYL